MMFHCSAGTSSQCKTAAFPHADTCSEGHSDCAQVGTIYIIQVITNVSLNLAEKRRGGHGACSLTNTKDFDIDILNAIEH